jgi:hypothetical protein
MDDLLTLSEIPQVSTTLLFSFSYGFSEFLNYTICNHLIFKDSIAKTTHITVTIQNRTAILLS